MKYLIAVLVVVLAAAASAEIGEFVPKAFYTIDSNGVASSPSLINPGMQSNLLHRLKRQLPPVFSSSSSSSSSSTSSNGGPVFFQQTALNHQSGPGFAPTNVAGLSDRFGDDSGTSSGTGTGTGTYNNGFGTYIQSSGFLYPNGQVGQYQTNTGKF